VRALQSAETAEIVDLCSGGAGPWVRLKEQLFQAGLLVNVKLTDKYPNPEALLKWPEGSRQGIEYLDESVDATRVPSHLKGMRTIFEGFHHFNPIQARSILQDALNKRAALGIFEASLKPPFGFVLLLISPIITIISYFLLTPFLKPRTLPRFIWTYLIPIVPLATCWDGIVSLLRVYSVEELNEMVSLISSDDYFWETGQASTGTPVFVFTYLLGYPV
jgi:hypothetical protein